MKLTIGWTTQKIEIEEGVISCEMRPLTVAASAEMIAIQTAARDGQLTEVLKTGRPAAIVREHVRNVAGIEDETGSPITDINVILDHAASLKLTIALLTRLAEISTLTAGDVKN